MQINWLNVWTGGSYVLLIGTNSAILILALAWSLVGLLGLPQQLAVVVYAAGIVFSIMAAAYFASMAHDAEPFYERGDERQ